MKEKLEVLSNIVILIVGLVWGSILVKQYVGGPADYGPPKAGERLTAIKGVEWNRYERTFVLVQRIGCRFCEESVPFYKKLVERRTPDTNVIAVFPDQAPDVREYIEALGLTIQSFPETPLKKLRVIATPTIILVDRQGFVVKSWQGQLTPKVEEQLFSLMKVSRNLPETVPLAQGSEQNRSQGTVRHIVELSASAGRCKEVPQSRGGKQCKRFVA